MSLEDDDHDHDNDDVMLMAINLTVLSKVLGPFCHILIAPCLEFQIDPSVSIS